MASLHELVAGDPQRGITAVLGPTNTGKTHTALDRMLRHRTGMIGLPLRLLAREVYDKLVERVGEGSVALITGEEKRLPARARYFVCTVEAMPVDRPVHFLAIDEVQLAAHRTRGHVFTDRLLRARGLVETLFLGSGTARRVVKELVPTSELLGQARLSRLRHAGHSRLKRLPPRTAVVAFSAARVYELAETLRRHHGGTAVVLGALSPRTRNAQVAMYQSGDVPVLVATDAIGMGLNLDVDHVAFAETRKFDGRSRRGLHDDELAQIAGRAGRFLRDGSFGTTDQAEPFDAETIEAIEQHRFSPIKKVWWRNAELDFDDLDGLLRSLEKHPPRRILKRMPDADDHLALEALSRDPQVRARASDPERLGLLWEVAGIPDYRKRLTEHHAELLGEVYGHLVDHGEIPMPWIEERLRRMDRVDGDIGALMTRIAHVRTWTFISHKESWVAEPGGLQERARALEDRLSDALHRKLTARFVDHRVGIVLDGEDSAPARVDEAGQVVLGERVLAQIEGLELTSGLPRGRLGELARAAAIPALRAAAMDLVGSPDDAFDLDEEGVVRWRGHAVARWGRGRRLSEPSVEVRGLPDLGEAHRAAVKLRIQRWTTGRVGALTAPLHARGRDRVSPLGTEVLEALEAGLGLAPPIAPGRLRTRDREILARMGVRLGRLHAYVPALLEPPAVAWKLRLWRAWTGDDAVGPAGVADPAVDAGLGVALGWPVVGGIAVRIDVLERVAATARRAARKGAFAMPDSVPVQLGLDVDAAAAVLDGLGFGKVSVGGEWRFVGARSGRR